MRWRTPQNNNRSRCTTTESSTQTNQVSLLRALLPSGATYDTAALQLERQAAELSVALVDALQQASAAANDATGRINNAIAVLEDATKAATPGEVVRSDDGTHSWVPDWSATAAASTIGFMADSTKEGLKAAALSTGDDLARGIAGRLGPAGAALGVIPAISNDIEGGMDPTQAVLTESTGAAAGLALGSTLAQLRVQLQPAARRDRSYRAWERLSDWWSVLQLVQQPPSAFLSFFNGLGIEPVPRHHLQTSSGVKCPETRPIRSVTVFAPHTKRRGRNASKERNSSPPLL